MARRIYSMLIVITFGLGYYLYHIRDTHSNTFLIVVSGLTFTLLSVGIHGLIAHSLHPKTKGAILSYPLFMGVLWAFLFFLFVFFVLPMYCPDFLIKP